MEKEQIGLELEELEQIFAQIKLNGDSRLTDKLYNAYLPLVGRYSKNLKMSEDAVQDIYNDVFCFIYDNVEKGVVQPVDFSICFERIIAKKCSEARRENTTVKNESLSNRLIQQEVSRREAEMEKSKAIARQSMMYIAQILNQIAQDDELMQLYGLTELHINVVKDYHGINIEDRAYTISEIAEKYNVTESRARAVLAVGLKKIRQSQELDVVKNNQFKA